MLFLQLIFTPTVLIITLLILILASNKKSSTDIEKLSSFECGFNPMTPNRSPFSMRFFLLAILFLIFDVEIALILPLPLSHYNIFYLTITASFLIILILSLLFEWKNNFLEWLWLSN